MNGLRPAVVGLICAASLSFVWLAVWSTETVPEDFGTFSPAAILVLILALVAIRRKIGVIKVLIGSGVLGLVLGLMGVLPV